MDFPTNPNGAQPSPPVTPDNLPAQLWRKSAPDEWAYFAHYCNAHSEAAAATLDRLRVSDWKHEISGLVFQAASELRGRGVQVNAETLASECAQRGDLEDGRRAADWHNAADACEALNTSQAPKGDADKLAVQLATKISPPFDPFDPFGKAIDEQNIFFESAPKPLTVELRPVPSLELEMLPQSLRDWLADVSERLCCPLEFVAVPALIALGSLIGRIAIRPRRFDDWATVPNLWGAVVARPGAKKSPAANEALGFLERLQATALERYERALEQSEAEAEINEAQRTASKQALALKAKKGAPRAELERIQAENATVEDAAPTLKRYLVNDTTVEALGITLQENPRGVLANRDELPAFLNSLDKQGREMDKGFYLEAFNGTKRNFIYDRIGRGRLVIPHVCVSLFGTIQPGPLTQLIKGSGEKSKQRDGFISRFQLLVYPNAAPYKRVDRWPDHDAKNRAFRVFEAFDALTPETIGATVGEEWELPYLRFDAEAQQFFDEWLDGLEMKLASGKETTLIEEHLAKYRSLMPSLALVFHVSDVVDGEQPGPITARAAMMAAAWCQYLEAHARRIYGQSFEADTEALERLGERLTELPNPFNLSDLTRKKWSGLTNSEEVESLLIRLQERGWIVGGTVQSGGRPAKKFWVNPALLKTEKGASWGDDS